MLDGRKVKANTKLVGAETLTLDAELESQEQWLPEDLPLDIVFEDESILVLNKPVGMVVHPAVGNWSGTLMNGLLFHRPELSHIPRAGIVHRLDKDTSGLMVVAKTLGSQLSLVEQLQAHTVSRTYYAVVKGVPPLAGTVDAPIGRHPTQRVKMAVVEKNSKKAVTHFERLVEYDGFSLLKLKLETGRTHQIRVHMAHLGYALIGDSVYGKTPSLANINNASWLRQLWSFPRQALHAKALGLVHPGTGEYCEWQTKLPQDFEGLVTLLEENT